MSEQRKIALITGITGQDGSYLTELLLEKGYTIHGIIRSSAGRYRDHPENGKRIHLHYGDLTDATTNLITTIAKIRPTEIYNLGAMSHVKVSFDRPEHTVDANALGVIRMLEAIRACGLEKTVKFYQASSSELFGKAQEYPQTEKTPFYPRSPYGVAKQFAFWTLVNYREAYGMHCCNGILYNHESPRRGVHFVTRKITKAVAQIKHNKQDCLRLGNIDAKRDWGHARDFVDGMWRMLQHDKPDDFILATGESHTVREFVEIAFAAVDITIVWKGPRGTVDEIGVDSDNESRVLLRIDPRYFRPTEVQRILGDPTKAKNVLGWEPKTSFKQLVSEMVQEDMRILKGHIVAQQNPSLCPQKRPRT